MSDSAVKPVDPLLDSCHNFNFFKDSQFENLNELNYNLEPNFLSEIINSNFDYSVSNDSVIDFDNFDYDDINLDNLLNENFSIPDNISLNISDNLNDNCVENQSNKNVRIIHKKPRKSKQKSILPITMRDVDENNHFQPNFVKSHLKNEDIIYGKPGDRLYLSKEERDLLIRDGYDIPTHLPLTKSEERALKNVRRKIRNKISAKYSRAKKETYVEGLEQRIVVCTKENSVLRQKLSETEKDKMNLIEQIANLQKQLTKYMPHSASRSTSILLLLITFVIILSPVFDPRQLLGGYNNPQDDSNVKQIFPGRTRMLLQEPELSPDLDKSLSITNRSEFPWHVTQKTTPIPLKELKSVNNLQFKNISVKFFNKSSTLESGRDL